MRPTRPSARGRVEPSISVNRNETAGPVGMPSRDWGTIREPPAHLISLLVMTSPYMAAPDRYQAMAYRRVGASGLLLPAISLGLWQNFGDDRPLATQRAIVLRAFDRGVTHFDLANNYGPPYGSAEANFGRILGPTCDLSRRADHLDQGRLRHVAGPYGDGGSRKYLLASLDQSLRRMGLDYVDIFYSHRVDPETPPRGDHGRARYGGPPGQGAVRRASRRTRRSGRVRPRPSCAGSARRCSSISRRTRCSTAGSRPSCSMSWPRSGSAPSRSPRSRRASSPTAISTASRTAPARRAAARSARSS